MKTRARPFKFWTVAIFLAPIASILFGYRIQGRLPPGPIILAPNHISKIDPPLLGIAVWKKKRAPIFMAKEGLFKTPVLGFFLRFLGQIAVQRDKGSDKAQPGALLEAMRRLRAGGCVVLYPEGTITKDPDLWPMAASPGLASLASAVGVNVVPVCQWGAHAVLAPYGRKLKLWPRQKIYYRFLSPIAVEKGRLSPDRRFELEIEVMEAIAVELRRVRQRAPEDKF